jgi:hypothetical protein
MLPDGKEERKRVYYYTLCIGAFSREKRITRTAAYNYLSKYKGINFLIDCYDAEHTLSLQDAVDDLTAVCKNNGGNIE